MNVLLLPQPAAQPVFMDAGDRKGKDPKVKQFYITAPNRVERNLMSSTKSEGHQRPGSLARCPHFQAHAFFISLLFIPLDIDTEEGGCSDAELPQHP